MLNFYPPIFPSSITFTPKLYHFIVNLFLYNTISSVKWWESKAVSLFWSIVNCWYKYNGHSCAERVIIINLGGEEEDMESLLQCPFWNNNQFWNIYDNTFYEYKSFCLLNYLWLLNNINIILSMIFGSVKMEEGWLHPTESCW